jgi:hypothetical protein
MFLKENSRARGMTQAVEHLLCKCKAPVTPKGGRKGGREEEKEGRKEGRKLVLKDQF